MKVIPYLSFQGRCKEAIAFYESAIGAKTQSCMLFSQAPPSEMTPMPPGDNVMHAELTFGDSRVFFSDGNCQVAPGFEGVSMALTTKDDAQAAEFFHALADGGKVQMPLAKTFFSSSFAMVSDRFGLTWMITVEP